MSAISIRYIVDDVEEAIDFYTERLGFEVEMHPAPGFAALSKDGMRLYLNTPGAGGAGRAGAGESSPAPGGWNRFQLEIDDLASKVEQLRDAGATFRGDIVHGQGGDQILLEDPSGNPIELFQPARH